MFLEQLLHGSWVQHLFVSVTDDRQSGPNDDDCIKACTLGRISHQKIGACSSLVRAECKGQRDGLVLITDAHRGFSLCIGGSLWCSTDCQHSRGFLTANLSTIRLICAQIQGQKALRSPRVCASARLRSATPLPVICMSIDGLERCCQVLHVCCSTVKGGRPRLLHM